MTSFWSQIQNEKSECFLPIISCFQQCKKNYLRRCWKRFCEGWSGSTGKASTSNSSTCFSSLFLTAGETSCSVARVSDVRKICIAENLNVALVSFHLLRSQTSMAAPFACRCFQNCSVLAILRLFGKFKWPCLWKVLGQLPSCICIQMRCQDHKTLYPC